MLYKAMMKKILTGGLAQRHCRLIFLLYSDNKNINHRFFLSFIFYLLSYGFIANCKRSMAYSSIVIYQWLFIYGISAQLALDK